MKILLANPPFRIKINDKLERYFVRAGSRWPFSTIKEKDNLPDYIPFPFYLAYTAAILEKKYQVVVDDGVAINETENEFLDIVFRESPNIILFETSTPTINYDLQLAAKIKKKLRSLVICIAGTHATSYFTEILKNQEIDFVFLGEYEINFSKLVEALSGKKSIKMIDGIAYREGKKIFSNKPVLIDPLDQLPIPARHLFPNNRKPNPTLYWDGFCQYKPAIQMHASRGCPFRCNFCLWNQVMYRNSKYRVFSPQRIVDEMEQVIKDYDAKEIYFDDDTFTADKKHVLEVCKEITKRKLNIHWSVMGDAMITDQEMIDAMADAGCIGIKFGVESGNKEILKHIEKPINFDKLKKFTDWCAKRKIKTHATFTFGLSGETKETMQQTLNLAKSLDVDSVQFSITTPFPGTRYYEELKKTNLLLANKWEDFDGASNSIVKFRNLSKEEIIKFCQKASGQWLLHKLIQPKWTLRQLYNLFRMAQGQGLKVVYRRFKRGIELILN